MNSGNPLGILYNYLEYKGKLNGVTLKKDSEAYTTPSLRLENLSKLSNPWQLRAVA
jgi:hypothetical protein